MNNSKIRDIATSFTTITFLVIAMSGVMMFFHFFDKSVKELHEILGLVFVVAACLHVIMNWKSMRSYFSKKIFISVVLIISIISGVFISKNLSNEKNPKVVLMQKVLNAPLADSFKLLSGDYNKAIKKLKEQNIKSLDSKSIKDIAKSNKTSPFRIISIITK